MSSKLDYFSTLFDLFFSNFNLRNQNFPSNVLKIITCKKMEKMRRIHEGGKAIFPGQIRERA